jgi:hypothetical protein
VVHTDDWSAVVPISVPDELMSPAKHSGAVRFVPDRVQVLDAGLLDRRVRVFRGLPGFSR